MLRICRCNCESDSADRRCGQAGDQLLPCRAAVDRFINSAAGATADHLPRITHDLPHARIDHEWILRVHDHVADASGVIDVKHLLPSLATIGSTEDATLGVRSPGMPYGSDEDRFGIFRSDDNRGDLPGIIESHVSPGAAAVRRVINTVSCADVVAKIGLTGSHPDHVWI